MLMIVVIIVTIISNCRFTPKTSVAMRQPQSLWTLSSLSVNDSLKNGRAGVDSPLRNDSLLFYTFCRSLLNFTRLRNYGQNYFTGRFSRITKLEYIIDRLKRHAIKGEVINYSVICGKYLFFLGRSIGTVSRLDIIYYGLLVPLVFEFTCSLALSNVHFY